jgi:hypothetical protein
MFPQPHCSEVDGTLGLARPHFRQNLESPRNWLPQPQISWLLEPFRGGCSWAGTPGRGTPHLRQKSESVKKWLPHTHWSFVAWTAICFPFSPSAFPPFHTFTVSSFTARWSCFTTDIRNFAMRVFAILAKP